MGLSALNVFYRDVNPVVQIALDPKWTAREVAQAIEAFDCKIIIADEALAPGLADLPQGAPPCGVLFYRRHPDRCALLDELREEATEVADCRGWLRT